MRHLGRGVTAVWPEAEPDLAEWIERRAAEHRERREALMLEEQAVAERRGASGDPDADQRDAEVLAAHCRYFAENLAAVATPIVDSGESPPEFSRRVAAWSRANEGWRREIEAQARAAWGAAPHPGAEHALTAAASARETDETRVREAAAGGRTSACWPGAGTRADDASRDPGLTPAPYRTRARTSATPSGRPAASADTLKAALSAAADSAVSDTLASRTTAVRLEMPTRAPARSTASGTRVEESPTWAVRFGLPVMLMRKFFSCTTVAPAVSAMPPEWAIVPANVPARRRPEVIGKRRPAAVAVPGAITDGVTPSAVRACAVPASRPSVVPPPASSTCPGVALRLTRPRLTPPGRSVPNAALSAPAAVGASATRARTTHVATPPEPRRMTLARERSMPASGMRAEPDGRGQDRPRRARVDDEIGQAHRGAVRRERQPARVGEPPDPRRGVDRPAGDREGDPQALRGGGPDRATDNPASVSTPAVAPLRCRSVAPPATGTVAARAAGADDGARGQGGGERTEATAGDD